MDFKKNFPSRKRNVKQFMTRQKGFDLASNLTGNLSGNLTVTGS